MGCGRSRHRSPSLQPDGPHKDKENKEKENHKENKEKENHKENKRAGRKQKQADKHAVKAVSKREENLGVARNSPARKTTNGKTGEVRGDWTGSGGGEKKENARGRNWQLEEAIDAPPETVLAVYRSSVPASARASLKSAPPCPDPAALASNGSLLNGGAQKSPAMPHEIEMQMEIPDKASTKDKGTTGTAKPVHITSSQLEFFKMLDEKIEKGADYDSDDE